MSMERDRGDLLRRKDGRWLEAFLPGPSTVSASRLLIILTLILTMVAPPDAALANGGVVQLSRQDIGPYQLTAFTSPSPIRVGIVDVSVLLERAGTTELVQNARVTVTAEPVGPAGPAGRGRIFPATHENATNKLYYAANVELPRAGRWRLTVQVEGAEGKGGASFEVDASSAGLLDNPWTLILFFSAPLLLAALWALWRGERSAGGRGPRPRR